jgi:fatty-acyl-CoA synthase
MGSTTAIPAQTSADSPSKAWLRALEATAPIARNPTRIFSTVIEGLAETSGDAPALVSAGENLTYRGLAEHANRYTRWALEQGLAKGDTICLMLPNRPEYMALWLGLSRAGCVVALLNTNLTGPSLDHCVNLVSPKRIIVAAELAGRLQAQPHLWVYGEHTGDFPRLDQEITRYSAEPLSISERRPLTIEDRALYIYTSGTTGMPKAANISHARIMQWSYWFAGLMRTQSSDRLYNCLPMYHSVGGILATGAVLAAGGSVAIRDGFSASQFWDDIVHWDCTLFQYIGELCRYLLHSASHPLEKAHRVRMCCGNGLRPEIWSGFQSRFAIPKILEFYAATEGNVSLFNVEGKPGAVGRIPPYLAHRFPAALVQFDIQNGEPLRNESGYCVPSAPQEPGELIGRIFADAANPGNRFEGYTSAEDTDKKILRHVFDPGDAWFRTGDLLRKDAAGYFYFVDRMGDTFRWKGENVATAEVAEALCACSGIQHANVYGVSVPGMEGRAGMAILVVSPEFDLEALRTHLDRRLPAYAHPLFLRIRSELETTGTFKYMKADFVSEGYNPSLTDNVIYFNNRERCQFVRLDQELYQLIQTGRLRL